MWQDLPGATGISIYPILRKPCIVCSSTFILKSPRMIIIIDPGGEASHVNDVERVVADALKETGLPVYIFLTHCHTDHFYAMPPLLGSPVGGLPVLHDKAARALETFDGYVAQADMIGLRQEGSPRSFRSGSAGQKARRLPYRVRDGPARRSEQHIFDHRGETSKSLSLSRDARRGGARPRDPSACRYGRHRPDNRRSLLLQGRSRVRQASLACAEEGELIALRVIDKPSGGRLELRDSKLSYLRHAMRMAGGSFKAVATGPGTSYHFVLPSFCNAASSNR